MHCPNHFPLNKKNQELDVFKSGIFSDVQKDLEKLSMPIDANGHSCALKKMPRKTRLLV